PRRAVRGRRDAQRRGPAGLAGVGAACGGRGDRGGAGGGLTPDGRPGDGGDGTVSERESGRAGWRAEVERYRADVEFEAVLRGRPFRFASTWGLFSPREVDAGTRMLLDAIEVAPDAD